jgi:hypothetical protein
VRSSYGLPAMTLSVADIVWVCFEGGRRRRRCVRVGRVEKWKKGEGAVVQRVALDLGDRYLIQAADGGLLRVP